ncbi:type II toxin-antitoxin system HicB family antitoxin [Nitrosomonas sp. Nm33]|uniref:type II toxin-antitoxin system HicB family antitoxin n=1 Tax=Nitrosomonas sp. Nm33 TaxID=133724 RepID=UPI000899D152|nr:type II toxin-antitoxin system HicB family antitoxin [Nitrosomonas sp. Nm33]SDY00425.1 antitoxin HicB [Nitrosomonas sp. Nm33]
MNTLYPAIFEPQEPSGYFVCFVDIPEAITQGETIDECLFNGTEVLSMVMEEYLDSGRDIPLPTANLPDAHYIAPDARIQSAILVRWARGNRSLAEIARALETSWPSAQRLEDPHHWPSLKQLEKAASVLGKKLVLSLE